MEQADKTRDWIGQWQVVEGQQAVAVSVQPHELLLRGAGPPRQELVERDHAVPVRVGLDEDAEQAVDRVQLAVGEVFARQHAVAVGVEPVELVLAKLGPGREELLERDHAVPVPVGLSQQAQELFPGSGRRPRLEVVEAEHAVAVAVEAIKGLGREIRDEGLGFLERNDAVAVGVGLVQEPKEHVDGTVRRQWQVVHGQHAVAVGVEHSE